MRFLVVVLVTISLNFLGQAPDIQARHSRYTERAEIHHLGNSATVAANSPRPLAQAVTALSEEYAWVIDFEDAPYHSKYDLVDDTAPQWRDAHPGAKGVTVIAGSSFQTRFAENLDSVSSPAEEERILERMISDYNESSNPGRFSLRKEGDGRFAVVGTQVKDDSGRDEAVTPILDTLISVPSDTRDALSTIQVILNALAARGQAKILPGTLPINVLQQQAVTIGGQNIPARVLLLQTLSAAKLKLYWHLYYDHDVQTYVLNVLPLTKASYDADGNRTTALIR